jgi:hypothetical protein
LASVFSGLLIFISSGLMAINNRPRSHVEYISPLPMARDIDYQAL